MAKFYGAVGFGHVQEIPANTGVWKDVITERNLYGDVQQNARQLQEGDNLNKDVSASQIISVVADDYANENIFAIRYVEWAGTRWTVTFVSADPHRPRLLLRLGGVYNGPTP
jgi:hypothetical protein